MAINLQAIAATLMVTGLSMGTLVSNPIPASAREAITCQSRRNQRETCPVATNGRVRLVRQLSRATCARNWGYTRNIIWVRNGCRAEFLVGNRYDSENRRYNRRDRDNRYDSDRPYNRRDR
ncbi:DUF3011 domain-containing protein [Merismopedia glauca]|uniref:DUF3011 domain-containing protein n=1 Tax=Merismopedia glauca CCAP 1448/3 TaxID=1296344 RepID=A0A2T1C216_9CYAN|nr:DUF3011 domain-containing protein [Merismopedia glauca]PSB02316.1 hypothetical protein C7B64_13865 [Merismopedia glauca CCAP 1448/3]